MAGYENKFRASDDFVADVRKKHGIPELASQEDMKDKVMELLAGDGKSIDDAITLMMNRRVDANKVGKEALLVKLPAFEPKRKYALLLMAASFDPERKVE